VGNISEIERSNSASRYNTRS